MSLTVRELRRFVHEISEIVRAENEDGGDDS
jgi:hypothetical protein